MISYLLNFVLCSGVLLLVYRVFLQGENLYKFNRFYLLLSLVFSLIVPLVNVQLPVKLSRLENQVVSTAVSSVSTQPVDRRFAVTKITPAKETVLSETINQPIITESKPVQQQVIPVQAHNYLPELTIGIYLLAAILLLLRFARNGYHIGRIVSQNLVVEHDDTKLVLLNEEVTPHSFLKYVFINKKDYSDGTIEPEIICHEQAHVRQLHSLDIILVELIQAVCWFNPIILLYRRAIQLNHEFLADEAVIKSYHNTSAYQYLLLNKASQGSLALASPFNYLTTKKRLIMMTKTTSAKIALYKQFAIVPVLAAALILFCHKVIAKAEPKKPEKSMVTDKRKRPVFAVIDFHPNGKPHIKNNAPVTLMFETKTIDAAKAEASQDVLNEYAAILKRHNIPYKEGDKIIYKPQFTDADREKIETLYGQMSHKQQLHQYIKIWCPVAPIAKFYATEQELNKWQNANQYEYAVWLDGNLINNSQLSKYKAADFDYAVTYAFPKKLSSYVKINSEVQLMTKAFYIKYCDDVLAKKDLLMYNAKQYWDTDEAGIVETEDELNTEPTDVPQQAPQQNKSGAIKTTTPPDFVYIKKTIPPAKNDAPQSVMDEYAALLKKHNLPADTSKMKKQVYMNADGFKTDRLKAQDLFNQMSKTQQNKQEIRFGELHLPSPKRSPSAQQLADWQNTKKFRVWIDDKVIDQKELAKYKAEDFDGWESSHLSETTNPNYKNHQYEVHLMTHTGYTAYYKQVVDDRSQTLIWTWFEAKVKRHRAE